MSTQNDFSVEKSSVYQRWVLEQAEIERVRKENNLPNDKEGWYRAQWLWLTTEKTKWLQTQKP